MNSLFKLIWSAVLAIMILAITQALTLLLYQFIFVNINFWIALIFVPMIIGVTYKGTDYSVGTPYALIKLRNMLFYNIFSVAIIIYCIVSIIWYPEPIFLSAIPKWVYILNQVSMALGPLSIYKEIRELKMHNEIRYNVDQEFSLKYPNAKYK